MTQTGPGVAPGEMDRSVIQCLTQLVFLAVAAAADPGVGKRKTPAFLVLATRRPERGNGAGPAWECATGDMVGWPQSCGGC